MVKKIEKLDPFKIKANKLNNNKVALIIGIENYAKSSNATYANLDAKYFFDYSRKAFGVSKSNIKLLVDEIQSLHIKTKFNLERSILKYLFPL